MNKQKLSIVVPMYNEEEMVTSFLHELNNVLITITNYDKEIIVVNDGSNDRTFDLLKKEQEKYPNLVIVNLSRNFGHESAIASGLSTSSGDIIIPMDADLQDPPSLIPSLIEKYEEGYDVVNAKRKSRKGEGLLKKGTATFFYKLIHKLNPKVHIPNNVGHFRLISRRVLNEVIKLNDYIRVFRVEVPYVGFKTTSIEFVRAPRKKGKTHYNYKAMQDLAIDSITSTSITPLKFIRKFACFNAIIFILSVIAIITLFCIDTFSSVSLIETQYYVLWLVLEIVYLFYVSILFILSLMSEYLGRTFLEAQKRPFFIIEGIYKKESKK